MQQEEKERADGKEVFIGWLVAVKNMLAKPMTNSVIKKLNFH